MTTLHYSPSSHSCTESFLEDLALDPTMDDVESWVFDEYATEEYYRDEDPYL